MGQGTRRGIQGCQECFPLRCIQPKGTPIRQRFVGTGKRALQNELAHGTIGCRRGGAQRGLSLACQTEIKFFSTERTGWHSHSFGSPSYFVCPTMSRQIEWLLTGEE